MPDLPDASPRPKPKWYHNVWLVLLMLFVVLGPFGLPLLWKSPRFSRLMKIMLTLATFLYTWWLVIVTITASQAVLQHFRDLQTTF